MENNDKQEFAKQLRALFSIYGKEADKNLFSIWWNIFEENDLSDVIQAFTEYAKNEQFPPVPAVVRGYLPGFRGISADEAWAHVPKSEHESGWMNQRMAQALGQATPLMNNLVSARMAFIKAYESLPDDDQWFFSSGLSMTYEQREEIKQETRQIIEDRKWVKKLPRQSQPQITNGLSKTKLESNKQRVLSLISESQATD